MKYSLAGAVCVVCSLGSQIKAEVVVICDDVATIFILGYVYREEGFASFQRALDNEVRTGHCGVGQLKTTLVIDVIAERYVTLPDGQEQLLFSIFQTLDGRDIILSFGPQVTSG